MAGPATIVDQSEPTPDTTVPASAGWPLALAAWAVVATVMMVAQFLSFRLWGVKPAGTPNLSFTGKSFLDGLAHFDAGWYTAISRDGYSYVPGRQSNVAFFPAYPLGMRGLAVVVRDHVLAGILLTLLSGAGAAVALWTWLGTVGLRDRSRWCALGAQLLYPYGFFLYGVVYGDALFLVVVIGVFLLAERGRWWWAGALCILATAGRPTGFAVALGLFVLGLERSGALRPPDGEGLLARWRVPLRLDRSRLRFRHLGVPLLGMGGALAYMTYLWARWGEPTLFSTVQQYWGQESGPRTWFKHYYVHYLTNTDYAAILTRPQTGMILGNRTIQALILLAVLVSVPFVGRRFGWGYAVFAGITALVPTIFTADFNGGGRYMMSVFPTFALLGGWLARRPRLAPVWLGVSALAAVAMMTFFAHGVYLT